MAASLPGDTVRFYGAGVDCPNAQPRTADAIMTQAPYRLIALPLRSALRSSADSIPALEWTNT